MRSCGGSCALKVILPIWWRTRKFQQERKNEDHSDLSPDRQIWAECCRNTTLSLSLCKSIFLQIAKQILINLLESQSYANHESPSKVSHTHSELQAEALAFHSTSLNGLTSPWCNFKDFRRRHISTKDSKWKELWSKFLLPDSSVRFNPINNQDLIQLTNQAKNERSNQ